MPVQAEDRGHLRKLLQVASGGVVFHHHPEVLAGALRKKVGAIRPAHIVVIADEAHRSQYDLIDGLARNLRDVLSGASFIVFTGTPIEKSAPTREPSSAITFPFTTSNAQ